MATITADLTLGTAVRVSTDRHTWAADEPVQQGGADLGPNPYELLLGALGACTCITIRMYCDRKGWALESVSTRFTYDRIHAEDCQECEEDATGYLDHVTSEIFIEGDFDDEASERLRQVASRCPVHKTLARGVHFTEQVVVG